MKDDVNVPERPFAARDHGLLIDAKRGRIVLVRLHAYDVICAPATEESVKERTDERVSEPGLTGGGHGSKRDGALLHIEGEELELQLAGGGQHVAGRGVDPAVGRDGGQRALVATGTIRDAEGTKPGEMRHPGEGKVLCSSVQV